MHQFLGLLEELGPLGVLFSRPWSRRGYRILAGLTLLLFIPAARPQDAMLTAALAAVGSLVGSVFFYEVRGADGEKFLVKYTCRGGGNGFAIGSLRYGIITVFIPALLPIPILPFKVFAACAGVTCVPRFRFFLVLAAARFPRYLALAYLGEQTRRKFGGVAERARMALAGAGGGAGGGRLALVVRRR